MAHGNNFIQIKRNGKIFLGNKTVTRTKIVCKGNNNKIIFQGRGKIDNCRIYIYGSNNVIRVGSDSNVTDGVFWIEEDGNEISIGRRTSLCGKTELVCMEGTHISIGDQCLFSSEIVFRTGDSHSILDNKGNRINFSQDIAVGNCVWICHRVIVNKGTVIREHSVIGTGSVLSKSFDEEHVIIAGNPGKIVKRGISWNSERK